MGGDARKVPLALWYANYLADIPEFKKQMWLKVHYVIQTAHLWNSIANLPCMNMLPHGVKDTEFEMKELGLKLLPKSESFSL
ncbi:MAG: hypothetical protein KDK97_19730 [Verrucomicrobiales bacterium]|nr:hypothetical protein [Verrucomicrobiales bacterium]